MRKWRGEVNTSSPKDKPGDRAHSAEEPKQLSPRRQLEGKAELEKATEFCSWSGFEGEQMGLSSRPKEQRKRILL